MKKISVLAPFALLVLSACVTTNPVTTTAASYDASIYQAAVFRPENLRPLKPAIADATGYVTVTTLTDGKRPWGSGPIPFSPWVSIEPEVKDKCRAYKGSDLAMYLRQIIGLKPDQNVVQFVTMTVKPEDLFRPTPDPRVDTVYPCLDPAAKTDCNQFPPNVDAAHKQWIAETFLTVQIPNGYPWTHLGYTYNWGPGDRYGASEYLIKKNANVTVVSTQSIADYCR